MKGMMNMRTNAMKNLLLGGLILLFATSHAAAELYVDSAPNVYGSPDWAPWWNATKTDVAAGTFQNMRSGDLGTPNVLQMTPYDEIVYSTGDLGKRIHWIYWLPGETTAGLDGRFEVKWVVDWAGANWTYEGGGWALDGPEVGWSQPVNWENYDDGASTGVIGSLGFAWWASDDHALPGDTGGTAYDETDQADIDALRETVLNNQTFATGYIRIKDAPGGDWQVTQLTVDVVPVPGAVLLGMLGLSVAGAKLRKRV